jgi:hypothetical protein
LTGYPVFRYLGKKRGSGAPRAVIELQVGSRFLSTLSLTVWIRFGLIGLSSVSITWADEHNTSISRPAPAPSEQQKMMAAIQTYADKYVSNLPNFICEQVTEQFEAGRKPTHWHKGDTLTSKLVFRQGREERSLELVNDKPPKPGIRRWRTPLITEGEFGVLLGSVFGSASDASFAWNRWDVIGGRPVAVLDYSIDGLHSTLRLSLSDLAQATVPYYGSVYADPSTGVVWRITNNATDIPAAVQTKSIATTIDYDQIAIGSAEYILPVRAIVLLRTNSNHVRNEMEFRNYRKFEAESTITYTPGTADNSADVSKPSTSSNPP